MPESKNSIVDLKKYLGVPGREVPMEEFKDFWESCTEQEKQEFKDTELE